LGFHATSGPELFATTAAETRDSRVFETARRAVYHPALPG
jgi:hypothetical protein